MLYLGIDIATKKTGIAAIFNGKAYTKTIEMYFDLDNLNYTYEKIKTQLKDFLKSINITKPSKIKVGIELANFRNAQLTQKFSLLAGMISTMLFFILGVPVNDIETKIFNSNEWQLKLPNCNNDTEREERKAIAKAFCKEKWNLDLKSEDEADALCIATLYDKLKSTSDTHKEVMKRKKQKADNQKLKNRLQKSIISRQKQLLKLTPKQVKPKERIENEIKELQAAISAIKD